MYVDFIICQGTVKNVVVDTLYFMKTFPEKDWYIYRYIQTKQI